MHIPVCSCGGCGEGRGDGDGQGEGGGSEGGGSEGVPLITLPLSPRSVNESVGPSRLSPATGLAPRTSPDARDIFACSEVMYVPAVAHGAQGQGRACGDETGA